jgi:hypothetical protein
VDTGVATDLGGGQGLVGARLADAEDVGEGDLEALVARKVDPDESGHRRYCLSFAEVWDVRRPRLT